MAAGGLLSTRKRGKGSGKFESHSTRIAWALALSLLLNVVLFSQWHKCGSDGAVRPGSRKAKHTERTAREGLEIRRTTIPTAPKGTNGLFTTEPIKKGDFVGFICGEYYTYDEFLTELYAKNKDHYVMGYFKGQGTLNSDPSNPRHIMGLVNEPPEPRQTNVESQPYFQFAADYTKGVFPVAVAKAMYATKDIPADSELFWNYGKNYQRIREKKGYNSEPEPKSFDEDKSGLQDPSKVLVDGLPQDCFVSAPFSSEGNDFLNAGRKNLKLTKVL